MVKDVLCICGWRCCLPAPLDLLKATFFVILDRLRPSSSKKEKKMKVPTLVSRMILRSCRCSLSISNFLCAAVFPALARDFERAGLRKILESEEIDSVAV